MKKVLLSVAFAMFTVGVMQAGKVVTMVLHQEQIDQIINSAPVQGFRISSKKVSCPKSACKEVTIRFKAGKVVTMVLHQEQIDQLLNSAPVQGFRINSKKVSCPKSACKEVTIRFKDAK